METFGDRLRKKRVEKKLSQTQIANLLGMEKHNAVSNWEKGNSKPMADDLAKIAQALDVSIDWLLTGQNNFKQEFGTITLAADEYIEFIKYKNERLQKEVESLKHSELVPI